MQKKNNYNAIKFAKSERRESCMLYFPALKTRQLKGVRENYALGKQICIPAEDLKGTIEPNVLYSVELEPMHRAKEDVVVPLSLVRLTLSTN